MDKQSLAELQKLKQEVRELKQKDQEQEDKVEVIEETSYISGEYLSAAVQMVAWQFIDAPEHEAPADLNIFADKAGRMMRQHCPIAYSYFFQNMGGELALPLGTLDIILTEIRKQRPMYLGGDASDNIFIAK